MEYLKSSLRDAVCDAEKKEICIERYRREDEEYCFEIEEMNRTITDLQQRLASVRELNHERTCKAINDRHIIVKLESENTELLCKLQDMYTQLRQNDDELVTRNKIQSHISLNLEDIAALTKLYAVDANTLHRRIHELEYKLQKKDSMYWALWKETEQLRKKLRQHEENIRLYEYQITNLIKDSSHKSQTDDSKRIESLTNKIKLLEDENASLKLKHDKGLEMESVEKKHLFPTFADHKTKQSHFQKNNCGSDSEHTMLRTIQANVYKDSQIIENLKADLKSKDKLLTKQQQTEKQLVAENERVRVEVACLYEKQSKDSKVIRDLRKENEDLTRRNTADSRNISQLNKLKDDVEKMNGEKIRWKKEKIQMMKQHQEEKTRLERQVDDIIEEQRAVERSLAHVETSHENTKYELEKETKEKRRCASKVVELEQKCITLESKLREKTHEQLKQSETSATGFKENQMVKYLEEELKTMGVLAKKFETDWNNLKDENKYLYEKQSTDAVVIRDLKRQLEDQTTNDTMLTRDLSQIDKLKRENEVIKNENVKLKSEKKQMEERHQEDIKRHLTDMTSDQRKIERVEQSETDKERIQTQNWTLRKENDRLEMEIKRITRARTEHYDTNSDAHKKEIEQMEGKLADERRNRKLLDDENKKLQKERNDVQRKLSSTKNELETTRKYAKDLERKVDAKDKEIMSLSERLQRGERNQSGYRKTADEANAEVKNLQEQLRSLRSRNHSEGMTKMELEESQKRVQELDRQVEKLKEEVRQLRKTILHAEENSKRNDQRLRMELEQTQQRNVDLEKRLKSLQTELESYRQEMAHKGRSTKDTGLKRQLEEVTQELHDVKQELDDTKSRLSKLMGQKLTDNNPNIADLSDKNRPTKLAERYTELYDNQWTDAFEIIDKGDEEATIGMLREILEGTMSYCRKKAKQQIDEMRKALMFGEQAGGVIPDVINKQLKDSRKAMAESSAKHLFQDFKNHLRGSGDPTSQAALKVPKYLKEAFTTCWLMSIQDPPVVLGQNLKRGDRFNTDLYKAYTASGSKVHFVVWPVLYLHERGAVLCKGVAQGLGGR